MQNRGKADAQGEAWGRHGGMRRRDDGRDAEQWAEWNFKRAVLGNTPAYINLSHNDPAVLPILPPLPAPRHEIMFLERGRTVAPTRSGGEARGICSLLIAEVNIPRV